MIGKSKKKSLPHGVFFCEFPWYKIKPSPLLSDFNPFEKYARQIASFPQGWGEHKKHWTPPPIDLKQVQVSRGLLHQPFQGTILL